MTKIISYIDIAFLAAWLAAGCPAGWLAACLAACLAAWLAGCLTSWLPYFILIMISNEMVVQRLACYLTYLYNIL